MKQTFASIATGLLLSVAVAAEPPPVTAYSALPLFRSMALSPDGSKIVALRAIDETYHAVLIDLASGQSRMLMASNPEEFLYDECMFANNERVICRIFSYVVMRAGDTGAGTRFYRDGRTVFTRLLATNADRSRPLQLVPEPRSQIGKDLEWNAPDQATIVSWLPNDKRHILIQLARDDRLYPSVYRLNIYNNKLERVRRHRQNISRWYADDEGNILLATGLRDGKPIAASLIDDWNWIDIADSAAVEPPTPLGFSANGKSLFVVGNNGENTRGIYRLDLKTQEVATLFRDDNHDASALLLHPTTRKPVYVRYFDDGPMIHWFDETLRSRYEAVAASVPGAPDSVTIQSTDRSMTRFILYTQGNGTVPAWYLYEDEKKNLMQIASQFAGLEQATTTQSITFAARDGVEIPGYLLLPEGEKPFPTVLLPHGGPYLRDTPGFDPWAELLVSRGYAVLKPNFRGSSGYGNDFMAMGFGEWGLAMQDDLIDGLDWMVESGIADPDRVCIGGASYGGYAALVAAYKTPERFRCAISFAGVTDLDELADRWYNFSLGALAIARLPAGSARDKNSPLKQVERIDLPLLIVHGDVDRSVMIEQSTRFVEALEEAGKDYTIIEQENGDHFLSLQSHRTEFFEAMVAFLAKHLK